MQRYLAGKTRILVTHQLQYVKNVDSIILIDQGKVTVFSAYQDLLNRRPEYCELLAAESEANEDSSLEKNIMKRQFSTSSTRVSFSSTYALNTSKVEVVIFLSNMIESNSGS